MRCCTVPILLAAFCAQGSVAYPIPEAFAAAYPELQDAASSALATAAEKRELETDDQAIDKESEVIREAEQEQPRNAEADTLALLSDTDIPASTVVKGVDGAIGDHQGEQAATEQEQKKMINRRAKSKSKASNKKGCHKTTKKVIEKTVPLRRKSGGLRSAIQSKQHNYEDGVMEHESGVQAAEADAESTTQQTSP